MERKLQNAFLQQKYASLTRKDSSADSSDSSESETRRDLCERIFITSSRLIFGRAGDDATWLRVERRLWLFRALGSSTDCSRSSCNLLKDVLVEERE